MDRQEFQRRRRALEELYQADLRLLRAAHEARVRSLEALWLDLEPNELPSPIPILLSAAEQVPASPLAPNPELPEPVEAEGLPPVPAPPAAPAKSPDLRTALEGILPALPTVFQKKDVVQALGWSPSRSSLYRVLSDMAADGLLEFVSYSQGRLPSQYRRV